MAATCTVLDNVRPQRTIHQAVYDFSTLGTIAGSLPLTAMLVPMSSVGLVESSKFLVWCVLQALNAHADNGLLNGVQVCSSLVPRSCK